MQLGRRLAHFAARIMARRGFPRSVLCISLAFAALGESDGISQKPASASSAIALVATLESLSVQAAPREVIAFSMSGTPRTKLIPFTITTFWAVPSNLTTLRVSHDGVMLFTQKAGDTNSVARRVDNVEVVLNRDIHDKADPDTSEPVVILVQAL